MACLHLALFSYNKEYDMLDTLRELLQQASVWVAIGVMVWVIAVVVESI